MGALFRSRTALILPLVLLVVSLLQDAVTYKVRQRVHDPAVRAAIILALTGVGFAIAAEWIGPWLKGVLTTVRKGSKSTAGSLGVWAFYAASYGALFWAYLTVERHGIAALLPASLR